MTINFLTGNLRFHLTKYSRRIILAAATLSLASFCGAADIKLDQSIGRFSAHSGRELYILCRNAKIACGLEEDSAVRIRRKKEDLIITSATPRIALDAIVSRYGDYRWVIRNNVVNIEPTKRISDDILSRSLDHISIHGISSFTATHLVLRQAHIKWSAAGFGDPHYAPVNIELSNATVRDALNAIAQQDGQAAWVFRTPADPSMPVAFDFFSWRYEGGMSLGDIRKAEHD